MAELPREHETHRIAEAAALKLITTLKEGAQLTPATQAELQALLVRENTAAVVPATITKSVAEDLLSVSTVNTSAIDFEKIWQSYQNEHLLEEIKQLTPEEIARINTLTEAILNEASTVHIDAGKTYGLTSGGDYHSSSILRDPLENYSTLKPRVHETLNDDQLCAAHHSSDFDNQSVFTLLSHPSDPTREIAIINTYVPVGTSKLQPNRPNSCKMLLIIKRNGQISNFLRSGKDAKLFMFALRNACVKLSPSSIDYLDVPLQGKAKLGDTNRGKNPLIIKDMHNRRFMIFQSTQDNFPATIITAKSDSELKQLALANRTGTKDKNPNGLFRGYFN